TFPSVLPYLRMPIPDYQTIMLPLLRYTSDGREHSLREAIETLGQELHLSDEELRALLPSGKQEIFDNRVGWARTYLKNARLVEYTKRGHFAITDRGREVLKQAPSAINSIYLMRFPEFQEFRERGRDTETPNAAETPTPERHDTPEETLELSFQ